MDLRHTRTFVTVAELDATFVALAGLLRSQG